jgi:hypothetical protein
VAGNAIRFVIPARVSGVREESRFSGSNAGLRRRGDLR